MSVDANEMTPAAVLAKSALIQFKLRLPISRSDTPVVSSAWHLRLGSTV